MTWSEKDHKRDSHGRFTHTSVETWLKDVTRKLNDRGLKRGDERPPGYEAAIARSRELWKVADTRSRTDAEQEELEDLEQAFDTYRKTLGLDYRGHSAVEFEDSVGRRFDEYGRFQGGYNLDGDGRVKSRSRKTKERTQSRKYEDWTHTSKGLERRGAREGGKIGRQYELSDGDNAAAFHAHRKRSQARARIEGSARQETRRTPRGTRVEGWMSEVDKRMGARSGT